MMLRPWGEGEAASVKTHQGEAEAGMQKGWCVQGCQAEGWGLRGLRQVVVWVWAGVGGLKGAQTGCGVVVVEVV